MGEGGAVVEEEDGVAVPLKRTRNGPPVTKLGRLVKDGKIKRLEDIYLFSLPIKVHCG